MAIVEVPIVVQTDEALMVLGEIKSPNKGLHDIVSHRVDIRIEDNMSIEKDGDLMDDTGNEDHIFKNAYTSPKSAKSLKATRRGIKQAQADAS